MASYSTPFQETAGRKTPAKISAKKLELEIRDVASSWKNLGLQLKIKFDKLKQIEKEKLGKPPPDESFQSVLQWWLNNTSETGKIWKVIYEALEDTEHYGLLRELKKKYNYHKHDSVKLDAGELSNLLFDVTPKWYEFGECLDVPDTQLKMTENVAGIRACLNAVLKLWLEGSVNEDPYWEDLVDALKRIGNARLARHIQERYLQIKGVEAAPETVPTFDPDANVDTSDLDDSTHLKHVLEALLNEPNWYDLGLELGLTGPKLEEIRMTNKGDVAECKRYMIMAWLQQRGIDPTWQNLCRALRKPLVGNNGLADSIAQKHLKH